jgi:methyl-galactoside transport system permease protein
MAAIDTTVSRRPLGARIKDIAGKRAILFVLVALIGLTGIVQPSFLNVGNIINVLMISSVYVILALGEGPILLTRGVDLSAGRVVGLTGCIAASMLQRVDYASKVFPDLPAVPLWAPILLAVVAGILIGILNGSIVAYLKVPPFITTLGTMVVVYGITSLYVDRPPHGATPIGGLRDDFTIISNGAFDISGDFRLPYILIIAVVIVLAMWVLLNYTRTGKNIYAIGANPDAATVSGVNVNKTVVGHGFIGRRLVALARALGMSVMVCDPHVTSVDADVELATLAELFARADYVVCLAAATPKTANLLDAKAFAQMPPHAFFINASRGELVDEGALLDALERGVISGAALDVGRAADQMPSAALAAHPKVIASPHAGGLTPPAIEHQAMDTVRQIRALLEGMQPEHAVNFDRATRLARLAGFSGTYKEAGD